MARGRHTGRMPPILIQGETGKSVERLGQFQIRQTQGWHLALLARDPSEGDLQSLRGSPMRSAPSRPSGPASKRRGPTWPWPKS